MKILAIRGKNLASLAGEFEVDFTVEPLKNAGIFAITGSTGSGKSTLMSVLFGLYQLGVFGSSKVLGSEHRFPIRLEKMTMSPITWATSSNRSQTFSSWS